MAEEMKNLNKEIIRYYDECEIDYWLIWRNRKNLATHYGFWERGIKTQNSALLNFNKVLAQRVKLESTDVVLDAGCGLGGSSIWLAKNYGCKAVGINIFEKQLNTARKYAKKYGVNKLTRFVLADFARTGFKPGTFDVVWGLESICYAENKKNFAREAHRILRKGGRLIIADGFAKKEHMKPEEEELLNKKWLINWAVPNLATPTKFKGYLKDAGFKNIQFTDVTKNIMPSSKKLYALSIPALLFGKIAEILKIRTKTQTGNIIGAYYQHKALKKGLWCYGILYGEK